MAITTFAELQTAVGNRMNRTDLNSLIPEFIDSCESRLNRVLRHPRMVTVNASYSISSRYTNLPTDFSSIERIVRVDSSNVRRPLDFLAAPSEAVYSDGTSGYPMWYSIRGAQLEVIPPPSAAFTAELVYFAKIPALSVTNTTNWLLDDAPDVYLYGTLLEAAIYMEDDARETRYGNRVKAAIDELMSNAEYQRAGVAMAVHAA